MPPPYHFDDNLKDAMSRHLRGFPQQEIHDPELRLAGVALVVAQSLDNGGACLLLTRRSTALRRHAGQYALPGGRVDEGETFQDAALRELSEELGLHYNSSTVLGALDDYRTALGVLHSPLLLYGAARLMK